MKMLAKQKQNANHISNTMSPTAEHLQEPSSIGKKDSQEARDGHELIQNIKISDMLKHQSKDLDEIIKEQSSHRSDTAKEDGELLQEPAIISSSQTLEVPNSTNVAPAPTFTTFDQHNPNLITAKTKPSTPDGLRNLKLSEI